MNAPVNFRTVEAGRLYRGGQPRTGAEWDFLKALTVRSVLKLNYDDEGYDAAPDMALFKCGMPPRDVWQAIGRPDPTDVARAVAVMAERALYPLYVHCTHGQDRTGLVVAEFRVLHQAWPIGEARREMLDCGFHVELLDLDWAWHQFVESREVK